MAKCRICGSQFKETLNSATEICNNMECWKKAWNDAVAPLRGGRVKPSAKARRRNTTPYEKELIIQLYKNHHTRRQIAEATGVSYVTVCHIIRKYQKEG